MSKGPHVKAIPTPSSQRKLVDETVCASQLSKSLSWIRQDRLGKKTIPFVRVAGSIRYDMERVMAVVMATEEGGAPRHA